MRHNTFAGVGDLTFQVNIDYDHPMPSFWFANNIFAHSTTDEGMWYVNWSDWNWHDPGEAAPTSWSSNIVYDITGDLAYFSWSTDYNHDNYQTAEYSSTLAAMSIQSDPLFVADLGGAGSYALSPASPAVDAGVGSDADGTPADIGAFGGPRSSWWQEVPWQVP